MTNLVCQCLNREEFKSCLSFLHKNSICWCNNEEINVEDNLNNLYDFPNNHIRPIECIYIFLIKSENKPYKFTVAHSRKYKLDDSFFSFLKKGMNIISKQEYYVVNLNTFIKTLTFYLETWN